MGRVMKRSATQHVKRSAPVVTFYRSYHFRADEKDPIIDAVHTVFDDAGLTQAEVHRRSGVAVGTLHNWWDGPTRRPQYATIAAVVRALGYDIAIVKAKARRAGSVWNAGKPRIIEE